MFRFSDTQICSIHRLIRRSAGSLLSTAIYIPQVAYSNKNKNIGLLHFVQHTVPVAVLVCRRFACRRFSLSPFWSWQSVAVLVSPFWRVAVLVCRRFDHTPIEVDVYKITHNIDNYYYNNITIYITNCNVMLVKLCHVIQKHTSP